MSCTAEHLRSRSLNIVSLSDMIEGSYRFWDLYTTGQLVDGLQQKKKRKPVFIKQKWNHVVFSRAKIVSFHPVLRSFCRILPKTMEHEGDGDTNCNWCTWNNPQRIYKRTGRLKKRRKNSDYQDYYIIMVGQNIENSPGKFRSLAVT